MAKHIILVFTLLLGGAFVATEVMAGCSPAQIDSLRKQGKSEADIRKICDKENVEEQGPEFSHATTSVKWYKTAKLSLDIDQ